jgi:hypothetical protein
VPDDVREAVRVVERRDERGWILRTTSDGVAAEVLALPDVFAERTEVREDRLDELPDTSDRDARRVVLGATVEGVWVRTEVDRDRDDRLEVSTDRFTGRERVVLLREERPALDCDDLEDFAGCVVVGLLPAGRDEKAGLEADRDGRLEEVRVLDLPTDCCDGLEERTREEAFLCTRAEEREGVFLCARAEEREGAFLCTRAEEREGAFLCTRAEDRAGAGAACAAGTDCARPADEDRELARGLRPKAGIVNNEPITMMAVIRTKCFLSFRTSSLLSPNERNRHNPFSYIQQIHAIIAKMFRVPGTSLLAGQLYLKYPRDFIFYWVL